MSPSTSPVSAAATPPPRAEPRRPSLVAAALAMGARPRLRIRLQETDDPRGDLARARPLFHLLASQPGNEAVVVTITRCDGSRDQVLFRCRVDSQLLQQLSALLKQSRLPKPNGR